VAASTVYFVKRDGRVIERATGKLLGYITRTRYGYFIEPTGGQRREVFVSRGTALGVLAREGGRS
jgi:hypothetical protein